MRRSVLVAGAAGGTAVTLARSSSPPPPALWTRAASSAERGAAASSSPTAFEFKPLDAGGPITKEALERGDVQVAMLSSSDADIAANDWVTLRGRQGPAAAREPHTRRPRSPSSAAPVRKALDAVSKKLTNDELIGLNRRNRVEQPVAQGRGGEVAEGATAPALRAAAAPRAT